MESLLVHGWLQNKAGSRKAHSTTIKKHVNRSRSANESRGLIAPPSIRARSHTTPTGKPYRIHHGRVGTDNFSRHSEAGHNDPITDILFPMRRMHIGQKSIYFNHFSNSETWDKSKYVKSVQESRGEILITLFYSPERQHLGVTISRAKNLIRCNETSLINSFVTVWMVRNGELIDKRTGAMKRQTTDPIFNDAFAFFVPQGRLDETQIIVAVSDVCSPKVMDEIGHVLLSIGSTASSQQHWRELLCNPGKKITRWHTLTLKW
ncbi:Synaptotagmin-7 [Trichinella britovi]|uniref:Synaptotagmin-7 n=2 Tax=Trichinella TaxID=6333 RepID=A0A0V1D464_TRIBR|nr:Synaptotagmin-7 [Trichinella murrelli]KRY56364.1 Synaptotagmin-7 [Trichinella britovi]KRZ95692.1 Synaptotagmin-7 [Trichinella sp. T8]